MCECKICGVEKLRTKVGAYKTGGSIFVDDQDRAWNGRTCPPCHHAAIQSKRAQSPRRHYRKRLKEEADSADPREFGPAEALNPPKLRACRTCKTMNPNYYECDPCRSSTLETGCFDEVGFVDMIAGRIGNSSAGWLY